MKNLDIAIIGAGIGGLTLALALQQRGFAPRIYERAAELGEVGAGITLWPNATRALFSLGLEQQLAAIGEEPVRQTIRHCETGEALRVYPRKGVMRETYGAPLYQIHRRDLHQMLVDAVLAQDKDAIRLGSELVEVDPRPSRPTATFADGSAVECDLVVGCDGIRSRVRTALFGEEAPRFTQIVAWRGLVPVESIPEELREDPAGIHIGHGCHVAHYTIRAGSVLNFLGFAVVEGWEEEGWTIPSTVEQMLEPFRHFTPVIREAIMATPPENLFKWGLFDRDVREQWTVGAVTVLGDAAHPMLPFLGQGAGMVIEDAIILARLLASGDDLAAALVRYEALRRPRTEYTMLKGRAHAHYYNSHPDEADPGTLEMEIDLNRYDAVTVAL